MFTDQFFIPEPYLGGYSPEDFMVLKIEGDGMYPAYHDGDLVLILKTAIPCPGDMAIVCTSDEKVLLGTFEKEGEERQFQPLNPFFPPIKADINELSVVGVPVLLLRALSRQILADAR